MAYNTQPEAYSATRPAPRCPACQLQLCKGRDERPHAALKETAHDATSHDTTYSCEKCGAVLVRTPDVGRPGWSQKRDPAA